jgi:hypothetical protein
MGIATCHAALDNHDEATAALAEALSLDPDNAEVRIVGLSLNFKPVKKNCLWLDVRPHASRYFTAPQLKRRDIQKPSPTLAS